MKTWLSWSTGKDSAWTFYQLQQRPDIELAGIFVTINERRDRVAMHGTRVTLLEQQAKCLGLPLYPIYIPEPCDNQLYEQRMGQFIEEAERVGVKQMAFGDLYLADIRAYRERQLMQTGIKPIFPLWQQPTAVLANTMIDSGVKAIITCVDTKQLPEEYVGRVFDADFLSDLPAGVDPCGENGEFHTFVYDAPMFDTPIPIELGQKHHAGQFVFIDVCSACSVVSSQDL
jgi:uncharacterized protein (TIGR00290 family)